MDLVTFKGNKDGISMLLDCSIDFEELCQVIVRKLWEARDFLGEHTDLVINTMDYALTDGQELALKVLLQSLGHQVKGFTNQIAVEPLESAQLVTVPLTEEDVLTDSESAEMANFAGLETYYAEGATLIIRKNIRSGQRLVFDGTLIIFGDVNAGAEIIASGHILVVGTMRGMAHAGCKNNVRAVVYAMRLLPIQLRIADLIARAPDGEVMSTSEPEIARIIEDRLVIETCLTN